MFGCKFVVSIKWFAHLLIAFAVLAGSLLGIMPVASAQSGTSDIAIVTTVNGSSYYDACFVLVNHSNEGCDQNRDGQITFEDIPYGSYTLRQTSGRVMGPDINIDVSGAADGDGWERFYVNLQGGFSDIAVVTTDNGASFYDACFVLVDHSNEGCDQNRDGQITFEDIPHGTYTLRQTRSLSGGKFVADTTIQVTGASDADGWERFYVGVEKDNSVNIALITRDPDDGNLLTNTCYVLVGFSNEGCDENADGQVTFEAVPPGTYTVRQTKTPAGYPTISDYEIMVENVDNVPLSFVVRQAPEQNAPGTRNVSIVFVDINTHTRLVANACVELVGASNVGCDEDLRDGQVDFLDVPAGTWEYKFSNIPPGWVIDANGVGGPFPPVVVDASAGEPSNLIRFIPVDASAVSNQAAPAAVSTGETKPMSITAQICDVNGSCQWAIGSTFIVTTTSGGMIGSCTLQGDPAITAPIVGDRQCQVSIPTDVEVVVTLDQSSVPAGYVVVENPVTFKWPEMVPSYVGVVFQIQPE